MGDGILECYESFGLGLHYGHVVVGVGEGTGATASAGIAECSRMRIMIERILLGRVNGSLSIS